MNHRSAGLPRVQTPSSEREPERFGAPSPAESPHETDLTAADDHVRHGMTRHGHDMAGHDMAGHASGGHDRHAGHSVAMFRDKFWLSLALTIPVVLASTDIATWFGYTLPDIPGLAFVPAVLGTIVFFYGGLVFIRGAQ